MNNMVWMFVDVPIKKTKQHTKIQLITVKRHLKMILRKFYFF